MRLILVGLGAVLMGAAAPAWAGDALCLWNAAPPMLRQNILLAYDYDGRGGPRALAMAMESPQGFDACMKDTDYSTKDAVEAAFEGYAIERGAQAKIQKVSGVTPDKLEAAWKTLGPEVQTSLLQGGPADEETAVKAAILKAALSTGWKMKADQLEYFTDYFRGHANRTANEPLF
jgi:hypothetical protein